MNDDGIDLVEFNKRLTPGQQVEARWTNSFRYYIGSAEVVRLNRASVRVRLLEAIGENSYPRGHVLVLPLPFLSGVDRWSHSNGVFPPANGSGVRADVDRRGSPA
jgi:hypothetical protein